MGPAENHRAGFVKYPRTSSPIIWDNLVRFFYMRLILAPSDLSFSSKFS